MDRGSASVWMFGPGESQRERIHACDDCEMLDRWLLCAIEVDSAAALLD